MISLETHSLDKWNSGNPTTSLCLEPATKSEDGIRTMSYYHFNSSRRSRSGVTLLFVVSMIVLFLLMGTAFVLVSNDFFRAAKKRSNKHVFDIDQNSVVEQAFYDLLRGPELNDSNSPLRGHSLLACLLYTSPSPRDATLSRMPSSA